MDSAPRDSDTRTRPVILIHGNHLVREALFHFIREAFAQVLTLGHLPQQGALEPPFADAPLVVVDTALGAPDALIETVRKATLQPCIGLVGTDPSIHDVVAAIRAGAAGYFTSDMSPRSFVQALALLATGEKIVPSRLVDLLADPHFGELLLAHDPHAELLRITDEFHLSPREMDILRWLAQGAPNKLIAQGLGVTDSTVRVHMKSILRKLKLGNRTQAAIWAVDHGLFDRDLSSTQLRNGANEDAPARPAASPFHA